MDDVTDPIWRSGPVRAALDSGDPGAVVRSVREAHHLTLAELGARCGYSSSTVSRLETGRQPLRDVKVLRSLADALGIPAHLLGLADTSVRIVPIRSPAARVGSIPRPDEETDPMRRRTLLAGLGGLAGSTLLGVPAAAVADPLAALEATLLAPPAEIPASATAAGLDREVAAARAVFQHGRYAEVAAALPRLLPIAIAAHTHHPGGRHAANLAELYTLSTELLVKVGHDHLAWTTADRALQAAYASGDILAAAIARRAWGRVLRRAGRAETANRLVIDTAADLQHDLGRGPEFLSVYGSLLSTAAYTAATSGDRDAAHTIIGEAADAARRVGADANHRATAFGPTGVDLYRVSIARALGDPGIAIAIAARINPAAIPTVERRGQYWTDVARAYHQWGKPERCYRALLAAEQATPDEVRHRGHIQQVTGTLLSHPSTAGLPGLRAFACRVGIAA
ncbi:helix-turn-helix domain-containing protein [Actinokineospora sp.]|uniref:helix-turn-helix domain-containing protein n=1 Tax=Actinokineospora sp. TaxID=1872133 RepID=UPI004037D451